MAKDIDQELNSKIILLGEEQKVMLSKFLDLFFTENPKAIRKTVINNIVELSDRMHKFAYEQGITEDIVEQIINYRR